MQNENSEVYNLEYVSRVLSEIECINECECDSRDGRMFYEDRPVNGFVRNERSSVTHYTDGIIHREDLPARVQRNGRIEWWKNGKLHRYNAPAVINVYKNSERWIVFDAIHRLDGPATSDINTIMWWKDNVNFRLDGPTTISSDGTVHWRLPK